LQQWKALKRAAFATELEFNSDRQVDALVDNTMKGFTSGSEGKFFGTA
jgi:hypothetical protein